MNPDSKMKSLKNRKRKIIVNFYFPCLLQDTCCSGSRDRPCDLDLREVTAASVCSCAEPRSSGHLKPPPVRGFWATNHKATCLARCLNTATDDQKSLTPLTCSPQLWISNLTRTALSRIPNYVEIVWKSSGNTDNMGKAPKRNPAKCIRTGSEQLWSPVKAAVTCRRGRSPLCKENE